MSYADRDPNDQRQRDAEHRRFMDRIEHRTTRGGRVPMPPMRLDVLRAVARGEKGDPKLYAARGGVGMFWEEQWLAHGDGDIAVDASGHFELTAAGRARLEALEMAEGG